MKGVMVLEYKAGQDGNDKLEEVSRQYAVSWVTAVEALDENSCLSADADCNLTVLGRDLEGVTEEDSHKLRATSEMRLGEMVNRIRRGKYFPYKPKIIQ